MTHTDALAKLRAVIADQLGVDIEEVVPTAYLEDDLGADSLDGYQLALALEEHFKVEVPDEQTQQFKTVQDIVDFLEKEGVCV